MKLGIVNFHIFVVLTALSLGAVTSCVAAQGPDHRDDGRSVYVSTNDTAGNAILVFHRGFDGTLKSEGSVPSGGLGSGGREPDFGLGNAGSLALSDDGRFLFAVNPGSNDISVFTINRGGTLTLIDREGSGGQQPLSVTVHENLLYVLNGGGNVGGSDNISGFRVSFEGRLLPLAGSTRPLSAEATAPAEIRFRPDGKVLVVTEKTTNVIDTYIVGEGGLATGPKVTLSDAQTPFGFDVKKNQLFVTDDFNDASGAGALSSWLIDGNGRLDLVSSIVPAHESGACWVRVSPSGRYAYVSDTVSSTVAQYSINGETAQITFVKAVPSATGPTELDFSPDGQFLYALNPNEFGPTPQPGVNVWRVNPQDGSLTPLPGVSGLPATVDGLVVR